MQIPAAVESIGISEGMCQSQLAITESSALGLVAHTRPPVEQPQLRCRSAKLGFEDNTCYGQEKLWVYITICPVSPHPYISLSPEASTSFENKV